MLRGNNTDSLGNSSAWQLLIREKGIMSVESRHVTIDGSSRQVRFIIVTSNYNISVYQSPAGADVTVGNLVFASNDMPEVGWFLFYGDDIYGQSIFLYVNIIIIGA